MAGREVLGLVNLAGLANVELMVELAMRGHFVHDHGLVHIIALINLRVLLVAPRMGKRRAPLAGAALLIVVVTNFARRAARLVFSGLGARGARFALVCLDRAVVALWALLAGVGTATGGSLERDALDGDLGLRLHLVVAQVLVIARIPVRSNQIGLYPRLCRELDQIVSLLQGDRLRRVLLRAEPIFVQLAPVHSLFEHLDGVDKDDEGFTFAQAIRLILDRHGTAFISTNDHISAN